MRRICLVLLGLAAFPAFAPLATAGSILFSAEDYTVLAASTVTNTGSTIITGDLGLYDGPSVVGFSTADNTVVNGPGSTGLIDGPGLVSGTIHIRDADAQQAQLDVATAYNGLAAMLADDNLSGQDLGGKTLTSGVYKFDSSADLNGILTLDAQGNNNAFWVFQIGSTLMTGSASNVIFSNVGTQGGTNHGLFWQVGSSATLGTTSVFEGNILALETITITTGAQIHNGRALARTGAVTMDSNDLSMFSPFPNNGTMIGGLEFDLNGNIVPVTVAAVPEPGSFVLIASGLAGLICLRKRFRSVV